MKKQFLQFTIFIFLFVAPFSPCFASQKNTRTIKPSLDAVGTFRRAQAIAENYELKILCEVKDWGKTDFVAFNKKSGEGVAYFYKYIKSAQRIVEFCYYNLAGECESEIRIYEEDDLLDLKNTFDEVDFTSGTHYMPFDLYIIYTEHLVMQREIIKAEYAKKYKMQFFDKINEKQPQVRFDDRGRLYFISKEK